MITDNTYNQMPEFIKKSIDMYLKQAIDEEFEEAKKRIDKRKSEIITGVILYVQKTINIQQMQDNLIITIKN